MTQPGFNDYSTALRMREVIAKFVREEMNRQRPAPRYGKVYSFNRFNETAQVLFPGDTVPNRVKVPQSVQPTLSIEADGDQIADVVKVEGVPGNLWVTEVLSGPTFQYSSQLGSPVLVGGEFLNQQVGKHFAPGTSQLPTVTQSWYFGRWVNSDSLSSDGLAHLEVVVQQSLFANIIKKYSLVIRPSDTADNWRKCVPILDSGAWSEENFNLEIRSGGDYFELRVRRYQATSSGFTPGGYDLSFWVYGQDWRQDIGFSAGMDAEGEPSLTHGTDSAEGNGAFLSPQMNHPIRSQFLLSGGGAVSFNGAGQLKWTERFMVMGAGKNQMQRNGFIAIPVPVGGVSIPIFSDDGRSSVSTVAGGVPMGIWDALYYEMPYGGGATEESESRLRIVYYNGTKRFDVPSDWILIATRNNDLNSSVVRLGNGVVVPIKQTLTYQSSWGTYGSGYHTPGFCRSGDRVFLEGLLKWNGASASPADSIVAVIPQHFRPGATCIFSQVGSSTGYVRIDVKSNGEIHVMASQNAGAYVSLDGISWRAEV